MSAPVFLLSGPRSGSTLLRVILNSHSEIHAPHELYLTTLSVGVGLRPAIATLAQRQSGAPAIRPRPHKPAHRSLSRLGLHRNELENLLWDAVLHHTLDTTGKKIVVDKTPDNVWVWRRLQECWPDARFVFLLRNPAAIAASLRAAMPEADRAAIDDAVLGYGESLEDARTSATGHTVRYEDLLAQPATVTRELCEFLGVGWEPDMLEYGRHDHGEFQIGLGDWSDAIRGGRIRPGAPSGSCEPVSDALLPLAREWGYAPV